MGPLPASPTAPRTLPPALSPLHPQHSLERLHLQHRSTRDGRGRQHRIHTAEDPIALGFENSIESISKLPQDLFAEVCQQIMFHLQCKTPGVNILEVAERLQKAGVELDVEATKQIVHVISLIFSKAAAQSGISAEELVIKLANSSSKWSKQALQVIRHVWNEQGKLIGTTEDAKHMLTVGELVDLQWKLGMAVSSDSCRSLNYPYVTMVLKVADPSGEIIRRSFEMTVPQFQPDLLNVCCHFWSSSSSSFEQVHITEVEMCLQLNALYGH
ncbi:COMM domain-containing protein 6 isoform X4 [Narcine bancroftii]|uniref:COMM domain-containing protein 6 isoform X4 n=1 Tax=Narcine bancroftii TaxID=1343680 RepID=UPI0038318020